MTFFSQERNQPLSFRMLALLLLTALPVILADPVNNIVGGSDVDIADFQWQVSSNEGVSVREEIRKKTQKNNENE